jgi:hypothetical protein
MDKAPITTQFTLLHFLSKTSECHKFTKQLANLHTSTFEMEAACTFAISTQSPTATQCKNPRKELRPILTNCFRILKPCNNDKDSFLEIHVNQEIPQHKLYFSNDPCIISGEPLLYVCLQSIVIQDNL